MLSSTVTQGGGGGGMLNGVSCWWIVGRWCRSRTSWKGNWFMTDCWGYHRIDTRIVEIIYGVFWEHNLWQRTDTLRNQSRGRGVGGREKCEVAERARAEKNLWLRSLRLKPKKMKKKLAAGIKTIHLLPSFYAQQSSPSPPLGIIHRKFAL